MDIAELYAELSSRKSGLFNIFDFDFAVQILEKIEIENKYFILINIRRNYATKLLAEMSSDDVADFLGELDEPEKKRILSLLEKEDREDLADLLTYGKNTAGGRMTTEYIAFPQNLKAVDVLHQLGELAPDAETIYYVFAIDSKGRLVGVVSLRDLILASEETKIEEFMQTDVKKINVFADREEVARLIKNMAFLHYR